MIATDDLIQEALLLRSWGWSVFPVVAKRPAVKWKPFQHRLPSDREIDRQFRRPGVDGIAAVTGSVSGNLVNRDYDDPAAYHRWADEHPDLARATPTVRTRRGYRVCARTDCPIYRKFDDGEVIGDHKHYVIMPPSRHPKGGGYEWVDGPPLGPSEFPILDPVRAGFLTVRQISECVPTGHKAFSSSLCLSGSGAEGSERVVPDPIREAVLRTLPTGPGQRNGRLHQFARALRDHVPDDAPPGLLFDAVRLWWQMALPVMGTKDFGTTHADFRRAFAAVRVPMSMSRPVVAMRRGASCGTDSRSRLLNACRSLAAETGGAFFLSARTAADAVGLKKTQATDLLKRLVATGDLVIVRAGRPSPVRRKVSTVYRLGSANGQSSAM